jgi:hypothetical protein
MLYRFFIVSLFLTLATRAGAQVFSAGVKAGTPFSETNLSRMISSRGGFGPSTLNVRRYTLGPTVEFALPYRLRFEADVLYKRLDQTDHRFLSPTFGTIQRLAANSWEFPLLLKYVWQQGAVGPFGVLGGSIRRINSFDYSQETFSGSSYNIVRGQVEEGHTQGGWVIGSGLRFNLSVVKISPEVRYTRWTSDTFLPTRNQVEFLLGLMF